MKASDFCSCPGCRVLSDIAPDLPEDTIGFIVDASYGITKFMTMSCCLDKRGDEFYRLRMYRLILAHASANMNSERNEEDIVNSSIFGEQK